MIVVLEKTREEAWKTQKSTTFKCKRALSIFFLFYFISIYTIAYYNSYKCTILISLFNFLFFRALHLVRYTDLLFLFCYKCIRLAFYYCTKTRLTLMKRMCYVWGIKWFFYLKNSPNIPNIPHKQSFVVSQINYF